MQYQLVSPRGTHALGTTAGAECCCSRLSPLWLVMVESSVCVPAPAGAAPCYLCPQGKGYPALLLLTRCYATAQDGRNQAG